jgi:hypothetical protein
MCSCDVTVRARQTVGTGVLLARVSGADLIVRIIYLLTGHAVACADINKKNGLKNVKYFMVAGELCFDMRTTISAHDSVIMICFLLPGLQMYIFS